MMSVALAATISCLAPAAAIAQAASPWTTSSSRDPMDDSRTYYAETTGKAVASNGRSTRPTLLINCTPGGLLQVTVLTPGLVIDTPRPGGVDVMVRVDTETARADGMARRPQFPNNDVPVHDRRLADPRDAGASTPPHANPGVSRRTRISRVPDCGLRPQAGVAEAAVRDQSLTRLSVSSR